jgi:hypothetical protein
MISTAYSRFGTTPCSPNESPKVGARSDLGTTSRSLSLALCRGPIGRLFVACAGMRWNVLRHLGPSARRAASLPIEHWTPT